MRVLCVGEMMVDLLVYPVKKISFDNDASQVDQITMKSGGDANNNAIDFAKLGNEVYYVGRAGCDPLADYVLNIARQEGVNVDYVCRSKSVEQTKSLILVNPDGNRAFIQYPGTSAEFCFEDIDLSLLDRVDLLQIGGTFHLPKFDGEGAARLLKLAREKGVITSMDVTKDPTGRWNEIIAPCYRYLDYFLPSIEQAACICGTEDEKKIADFFLDRDVTTVVVKLGSRGCYCKSGDKAFYCGCYTVPVAETTGAGDAFVAGFLTAVGKGRLIEDCVRFGTASSAHAVQAFGATAGVPDFGTVCSFMEEHPELKITLCRHLRTIP